MLYNWQPFFLLPFLSPSLLGNNQLVSAARLPFRTNPTARQELTSLETTVDVPGLSDLAAYVCPNVAMANSVKRQNPGATTVAVPKNELQALLLQLQQMELAILVLLQQIMGNGGLDPLSPSALPSGAMVGTAGGVAVSVFNSSPPPSPFPSPSPSSVNLASPTSIDFAALSSDAASTPPVLPTANAAGACTRTYGISTTTLRSTITVTASIVTVTAFGNDTGVAASSTPSLTHEATSRTTALEYAVATSTSGGVFLQLSRSGAAPTTLTGFSNDTSVAASRRTSLAQEATLTTTALDSGVAASTSGGIVIQLSGSGAAPTTSDPAPPKYSGGTAPASGQNSTGYRFNAQSSKNVAVYFGQTPATGGTTLAAQCADPSVDIVILAFVISSADGGQYPAVNFGAACGGQTTEMISKAPGLLSCPQLATNITTCQSKYGKKVMLSIGGATSQISFPTAASASTFATTMWNLFGPPGNVDMGLRPFGTVQIDGFDVDNEDNLAANWGTFASTLRSLYASNKEAKTYYLSSAPQCPFPDASNPQALLLLCDFVWVQFYNNPGCQIGAGAAFTASVRQWSSALESSTLGVKPRLYVGAPAFSAAGSSAYQAMGGPEGMQAVASTVEGMALPNFGGVMFWDGPEGMLSTAGGKNILDWAKQGLNG